MIYDGREKNEESTNNESLTIKPEELKKRIDKVEVKEKINKLFFKFFQISNVSPYFH
jgi:hypothetical protein